MDCKVHRILQARIPEWVAVLFSGGSSESRDGIQVSCVAGRFFTILSHQGSGVKDLEVGRLSGGPNAVM